MIDWFRKVEGTVDIYEDITAIRPEKYHDTVDWTCELSGS